ncbi:uncharacterized protein KD926_007295 [Aspergillus affinis]|uniref:uncharacterized protein n=1 Tax=Aspergillus affinis TaxID=1070780 RepID=UPI0022FE4F31|nr:uncharacterized protein KD926_007295 [Aspergillus affinis]KAI9041184.1 hypothetical protein KD926_007295 [Aspergillus affinis]
MWFLLTLATFNVWGLYYPVPGLINPSQSIMARARGAFGATCVAASLSTMTKEIYIASHQDASSVGTAVGFPRVESLSVIYEWNPEDDFRCWEWEKPVPEVSVPEQSSIPPSDPPSIHPPSSIGITLAASCALLNFIGRQRRPSPYSERSTTKTESADESKEGTSSSPVLFQEPKGTEVAREPSTLPGESHSEVSPSSPHLAGQQTDTEQVNPEGTVAPESESEEVARNLLYSYLAGPFSYLDGMRPDTEQTDPEETSTADPEDPPATLADSDSEVNPEDAAATELKGEGEEVATEPLILPAKFQSKADLLFAYVAGKVPYNLPLYPEDMPLMDFENPPRTPAASYSEVNLEEAAATEPATMPSVSHSEAGLSSSYLVGQQPDTEQVNLEETAATEDDANSISSRLSSSRCRLGKAKRDRHKRRLTYEAAEAAQAQAEAEANADAPSDPALEPEGQEAVRDPPMTPFLKEAQAARAEARATGQDQRPEQPARPSRRMRRRARQAALAAEAEAGSPSQGVS